MIDPSEAFFPVSSLKYVVDPQYNLWRNSYFVAATWFTVSGIMSKTFVLAAAMRPHWIKKYKLYVKDWLKYESCFRNLNKTWNDHLKEHLNPNTDGWYPAAGAAVRIPRQPWVLICSGGGGWRAEVEQRCNPSTVGSLDLLVSFL